MTSDNILNLIITLSNVAISFFAIFKVTNKEKQLLRYNYEFEKSKLKINIFEKIIKELSAINMPILEYVYVDDYTGRLYLSPKCSQDIASSYDELKKLFFKYIFMFKDEDKSNILTMIDINEQKLNSYDLEVDELQNNNVLNQYNYYDLEDKGLHLKYHFTTYMHKAFNDKIYEFMVSDLFEDFE